VVQRHRLQFQQRKRVGQGGPVCRPLAPDIRQNELWVRLAPATVQKVQFHVKVAGAGLQNFRSWRPISAPAATGSSPPLMWRPRRGKDIGELRTDRGRTNFTIFRDQWSVTRSSVRCLR